MLHMNNCVAWVLQASGYRECAAFATHCTGSPAGVRRPRVRYTLASSKRSRGLHTWST